MDNLRHGCSFIKLEMDGEFVVIEAGHTLLDLKLPYTHNTKLRGSIVVHSQSSSSVGSSDPTFMVGVSYKYTRRLSSALLFPSCSYSLLAMSSAAASSISIHIANMQLSIFLQDFSFFI